MARITVFREQYYTGRRNLHTQGRQQDNRGVDLDAFLSHGVVFVSVVLNTCDALRLNRKANYRIAGIPVNVYRLTAHRGTNLDVMISSRCARILFWIKLKTSSQTQNRMGAQILPCFSLTSFYKENMAQIRLRKIM